MAKWQKKPLLIVQSLVSENSIIGYYLANTNQATLNDDLKKMLFIHN
jgi:hypothetical protein